MSLQSIGLVFRDALWRPLSRARAKVTRLETRLAQRRFVGTQICVTGSCGKSTVTRLIGMGLKQHGHKVLLTGHPNFGSGLLRPVRKLRSRVDYAVQEVSGHAPGVMTAVVRSVRVDIAVVTSVGTDHGASFKGLGMSVPEAIALEKGRVAEAVPRTGAVYLNADDPLVAAMRSRCTGRVVTFGMAEGADYRAVEVTATWPQRLRFVLETAGGRHEVRTHFAGRLMLTNVLAALAVLHGTGMPLADAIATIAEIEPVPEHMSVHEGDDGRTYILDTFKAPQWSTEMLIEDIHQLGMGRMMFVLGEISEVSTKSGPSYRRVIRRLAEVVDEVVLTASAAHYGRNLPETGVPGLVFAPTSEDVARHIAASPHKLVLLKSSKQPRLADVARAAGVRVAAPTDIEG